MAYTAPSLQYKKRNYWMLFKTKANLTKENRLSIGQRKVIVSIFAIVGGKLIDFTFKL